MTTRRLDLAIWVLIFVGLFGIGLGLAVQSRDAVLGWGIAIGGGIATVFGVVLVWVRSRIEDPHEDPRP